jgi:hypothetical protein
MSAPTDPVEGGEHQVPEDSHGPRGSVGDATMRAAIVSVFGCGLCFAVAGVALFGVRAGFGVLLGAVLATLNLWVFARVGEAFVARRGNTAPWGVIAVLKLLLLFGAVWVILKSEIVSGLSLAGGYAALPFGVTFASLFGPRPSEPSFPPVEPARNESARRDRDVIKRRGRDDEP